MKTLSLPCLTAALMLTVSIGITPVQAEALQHVGVQQAQQMKNQGALLIDVREPEEYAAGHAPGSVLIPVGQLNTRLKELNGYQNKPVVLICRSGRRSMVAAEILQKAGFGEIRNVVGGMLAWEKAGLPVVQPVGR
ncbi:hypothetical protein GCM10027343_21800 [Noviherbaspirillum agri]